MSAVQTRTFELMSTVTIGGLAVEDLEPFAAKLSHAVGMVLPEFPAVVAFLVEPLPGTTDVNFGLRFSTADPEFVEDMATEILEKAVEKVAEVDGVKPVEAEREDSVLVLTR